MGHRKFEGGPWADSVADQTCRRTILLAPVVMLGAMLAVKYFATEHYPRMIKEDGVLEYLQALCYACAGLVSLLIFDRFFSSGRRLQATLYLTFAVGMIFVAAEEVSWGQRIADIETPEVLMQWNVQREISVHNLRPVQSWLHTGYIVIGLVAGLAWIFVPRPAWDWRDGSLGSVLPGRLTTLYFLPVAWFYLALEMWSEKMWFPSHDQEIFETLFAAGFLVFAVLSYRAPRARQQLADIK